MLFRPFNRSVSSSSENECRKILEKMFSQKFPNTRPKWLINPVTKRCLEIDCYNDKLKLGIEYNGIQHYQFVRVFHKDFKNFRLQQYRDYVKEQVCKENGVKLITVPYSVKIEEMEKYILEKMKK